jgi:acylphosphatase
MPVDGERLTARITGRVQGVGFRWWARRQASNLGLTGWVVNGDDELTVQILAEGPIDRLDELERRLWSGPEAARVERVTSERTAASGEYDGFGIVRG